MIIVHTSTGPVVVEQYTINIERDLDITMFGDTKTFLTRADPEWRVAFEIPGEVQPDAMVTCQLQDIPLRFLTITRVTFTMSTTGWPVSQVEAYG